MMPLSAQKGVFGSYDAAPKSSQGHRGFFFSIFFFFVRLVHPVGAGIGLAAAGFVCKGAFCSRARWQQLGCDSGRSFLQSGENVALNTDETGEAGAVRSEDVAFKGMHVWSGPCTSLTC